MTHNILLKHENKNIQSNVCGTWWSAAPIYGVHGVQVEMTGGGWFSVVVVRWMDLLTSHSSWLNFHCQFGSLESESLASMVKEGPYPSHFFMAPSLAPSNYQSSPSITILPSPLQQDTLAQPGWSSPYWMAQMMETFPGTSFENWRSARGHHGMGSWDGGIRGMLGNPVT